MEGIEISLDDLRAVLESKGLDIKELAQEAKELKAETDLEEKIVKTATRPQTSKPVFELALVNYPDFVIRRSTAKTEKFLTLLSMKIIKQVCIIMETVLPFYTPRQIILIWVIPDRVGLKWKTM